MLGLLTSHLHANYRYWDYWDSAGNSVASAHIHTQTHAHTHTNTLALTCARGLAPWRFAGWSQSQGSVSLSRCVTKEEYKHT